MQITLIDPHVGWTHPSYRSVQDFLKAWDSAGAPVLASTSPGRLARRFGLRPKVTPLPEDSILLLPLMGPRREWVPRFSHEQKSLWLYCWDVWPSNEHAWRLLFGAAQPGRVLMASRDAAEKWSAELSCPVDWVPDATNIEQFGSPAPLLGREIDVLELGRRSERFHAAVTAGLQERGYSHRYQEDTRTLVFPTHEGLIRGLRSSKTVVCFPGSETHPEKYGTYSVLTQRYLETMAAGAVPIGHCPTELWDLLHYSPVVEVGSDPLRVVTHVLEHLADFEDLVERNKDASARMGSWEARVAQISEICRVSSSAGGAPT